MANTYSYLTTERVSVVHTTPSGVTPIPRAATVRIVGTCNFLFNVDGDATNNTSVYVPAGEVTYVALPNGCPLSVMAEEGTAGTHYVYVTEVLKA